MCWAQVLDSPLFANDTIFRQAMVAWRGAVTFHHVFNTLRRASQSNCERQHKTTPQQTMFQALSFLHAVVANRVVFHREAWFAHTARIKRGF
jgi:hypothetical protein